MRKFLSIRSFLLGFLCFALVSQKGAAARPLEVTKTQLEWGCGPFARGCPSYFYCLVDGRWATWGTCTCPGFQSKQLKPPKDNGTELAPPLTKEDCELVPTVGWYAVFFWICFTLVGFRFFIGSLMALYQVHKNGGLKLNNSCVALFSLIVKEIGVIIRGICYFTYRLSWDPNSSIFKFAHMFFPFLETPFGYFMRYEIVCIWLDLLEKSIKMSKNSSTTLKIVKLLTRLWGLFTLVIIAFINMPGISAGLGVLWYAKLKTFMVNAQAPFLGGVCAFIAPVLVRMLCKDMRDVTHPNWKAAAAVRRTAFGEVLMQIFLPGANNILMGRSMSIWADTPNYGECLVQIMFFYMHISDAEWLGYLLFAHRKHLNVSDGSSNKISNFFGFSTLGLNGSVTSSVVSRISGKSSMTSSVDETNDDTEKKEIA